MEDGIDFGDEGGIDFGITIEESGEDEQKNISSQASQIANNSKFSPCYKLLFL